MALDEDSDVRALTAEDEANLSSQRWRLENLYSVVDEDGHVRPFKPNEAQSEFLDTFHGRDLILKARQRGFTTLIAIIELDACIWTPNTNALIIAHRQDDARKIFRNKVKWVWDQFCVNFPDLVEALGIHVVGDSASELRFSNDSSIVVDVSGRSGTYQYVLVTEFGKMCAQFGARADEVVTGTLQAAHKNSVVIIESTAEGQSGHFYRMARRAQAVSPGREWPDGADVIFGENELEYEQRELDSLDYCFHFYPWWSDPKYRLNPRFVQVPDYMTKYFDETETLLGIEIDPWQRAWYSRKEEVELGGEMQREFPSYPAEAFGAALEGCFFERQLLAATRRGRIGAFPLKPGIPVNTFWDLGRSDYTAIWLHQRVDSRNRFVGYYENCGEHISFYSEWLERWRQDNQGVFGTHYGPHDIAREDQFLEHGRMFEARKSRLNFVVAPRCRSKTEEIAASRGVFPSCDFDAKACGLGLKRLRHYRKERDNATGMWRDTPVHDESSHCADAFGVFSLGYRPKERDGAGGKRQSKAYTGGLA